MLMWDSIFILIHHFHEPFKKKDIFYLVESRLNDTSKKNLILFHDLNIKSKCNECKEFQPWIMVENSGEALFLVKKFIEKCEPWITTIIQENVYNLDLTPLEKIDSIFVLITKINSRKKLYEIINQYKDLIQVSDIRIKNQCYDCEKFSPWLIIENSPDGISLINELNEKFKPYIIIKKQRNIYKHNIPKEIRELKKWKPSFGNLRIEI